MNQYKIIKTKEFNKFEEKLSKSIRKRFEKQINLLRSNPYLGKQLTYRWLRELKVDKFRMYYLIYETEVLILFMAGSSKKNQKTMIEQIKRSFSKYRNIINDSEKNLNDEEVI